MRGLPSLPASRIIGRSRDLAFVLSTVQERSTQLLTILGPGGVGKTRLALTAAWELAPLFRDGVVFIPFTTPDIEKAWQMIMHRLDILNPPELPRMDILREALQSRETLIILDNCETLPEAFSMLPNLLLACPGVMVIATSQEALRVRGEQEFWLEPLELPENDLETLGDLDQPPAAVELFTHRARRRNAAFTVTDENAHDVTTIVRMLDGLPLAIELAAAQMRHLSPAALRQRLESALPSLSGGARDLPERQRSLLSMTQWSLGLLREEDRIRFLQLSILMGDFTPEGAARIVGLPLVEAWELLISFADRSLIKRVVGKTPQSTRFFMLQTVQKVAVHLLKQHPKHYLEATERHAEAFLGFAREVANHWHGADQVERFQQMEEEHPNIELVMENALSEPRLAEVALELAEPLFWYWYSRGFHSWALQRIEKLLNLAPDTVSPYVRGSAHVTAGWLAFKQTQVNRAEYHFAEGLRLIPDAASRAALRGSIGMAYVISFDGQNTDQALEQLDAVIQRARTNPYAWHELAAGHFGWGLTNYFSGHIAPARAGFEASLQISRARNDLQSIAMNLLYLAHTDRIEGKPRAAIRKLQEVVPIFRELGDDINILLCLDVVVSLLADLGEIGMARRIATVSEHTRRYRGSPRSPLEQGDFDDAIDRIGKDVLANGHGVMDEVRELASMHEVVEEFLRYRPASAGQPDNESPVAAVLSPRELEVLRMVADGKTAAEIAKSLFVSPHTIKRHMANIREKLGVRTQAAAVAALQRTR
jgi:predicted ATPase/DNA-binding CsgD family transcriptional regulator